MGQKCLLLVREKSIRVFADLKRKEEKRGDKKERAIRGEAEDFVRKIHKDPNEARYVYTRFRVLTFDTIHHQSSDREQCQESFLLEYPSKSCG
jgi:hypothetical protein